ncbi:MAG TPA: hypothetical protein VFQ53_13575 [Kofleriaceae bacterium]|nr:hypothetical protein [Kofleriaceae bacterium]
MSDYDNKTGQASHQKPQHAVDDAMPKPRVDAAHDRRPLGTNANATPKRLLETPGHRERSWVRPSTTPSNEPTHVGSVFFRTKDSNLDSDDRALLVELARAYAGDCTQSRISGDGVSGEVVGYADPRTSHEPDNRQLSAARASHVASSLTSALRNEPPATGFYGVSSRGEGVAPGADEHDNAMGAEGNTLAPYRRADIYLRGRAHGARYTPGVKRPVSRSPMAPDFSAQTHDLERWLPYVEQGNRQFIEGIASRGILFATWNDSNFSDSLRKQGLIGIEPPWWSGRAASVPSGEPYGRANQMTEEAKADRQLIAETRLLVRDIKECAFYVDAHFTDDYHAWSQADDEARVQEAQLRIGYVLYMYTEIGREARDLKAKVSR